MIGGPRRATNSTSSSPTLARAPGYASFGGTRHPKLPGAQFTATLLPEPVTTIAGLAKFKGMSETPDPSTQPTPVAAAPPPPPPPVKPPKVYTAAAWVVIVAGIVFILSVVFFSALVLGYHDHCYHRYHHGMFKPGGPGPRYGPWPPGGPGGPGMAPPFPGGPGGPAAGPYGPAGPGQLPTTTVPSPAPSTPPARP